MNNKDWQKKGNEFWNVVQDAVNSGNFQQLNQQVKETIDDTVEGIRKGMQGNGSGYGFQDMMRDAGNGFCGGMKDIGNGFRDGMRDVGNEWREAWKESGQSYQNRYQKSAQPAYQAGRRKRDEKQQLPAVYSKNPPGQVSGIVMSIIGYVMMSAFGIAGLSCGLVMAFLPSLPITIVTAVMSVLSLSFLGVGLAGTSARRRVKRFRAYVRQIGSRAYCTVEELAKHCGRDQAAVVKDLKKMIEKRMFLQGHLDAQETCVIVTNEMYQQYLTVQQQAKERQEEQESLKARQAQMPEECRKIIEEGREYIAYIRKCNDDIPGEEISRKLSRLELIITRIFAEVEKNPGLASDLRKFMNYYLPTTGKLINAYREMDQEVIKSENIEKTKREIEDTLDTINQAFENLLNSFFEDKAMDISSDISVLHTMLAQEGLTKSDFEKLQERGGEK